jgi:predicted Zn-dependent protease
MKDYDAAAKVVSGAVEQFPGQLHLRVSYASLLSKMDKTSEANKQYNIILKGFTCQSEYHPPYSQSIRSYREA